MCLHAHIHPEQVNSSLSHNHSVEPTVFERLEESRAAGQNPRKRDLDLGFKLTTFPCGSDWGWQQLCVRASASHCWQANQVVLPGGSSGVCE